MERMIRVALTATELHFLQSALIGKVDMGWHGNLKRADELHQRFEDAQNSLRCLDDADRLARRVSGASEVAS